MTNRVKSECSFFWLHYRYSGKERSTNMVILDIKMLSGFVPDPQSLGLVSYYSNFNLNRKGRVLICC